MQRHPDYTRTRIRQLADRMFKLVYAQSRPVDQLLVSDRVDRITFAEAQQLKNWKPCKPGAQFGPLWATFWFRGNARVPKEWAGKRVDLRWISHSEATLWVDGKAVQGLNHEPTSWDRSTRAEAILLDSARGDELLEFQIEMACNRVFGDPGNGGPFDRSAVSPFVFEKCDIALFDPEAWKLYYDFVTLVDLEAESSKDLDKTWGGELLSELNRFANEFDPENRKSWRKSAEILKPLYQRKNATRVHELSAIGHAHIDTAWLWPLAETWRKCDRTFSSQLAYMRDYPEFKFACSQAYQYEIIRKRNPELYGRIKVAAKKGQWIPVGGTWIEPDCNIPSGESLIRQFLLGQRYFQREFGTRCREFWNPDVFGYNGQLPQIMRLCGVTRFLTQKLSWNRFTKPLYHTFTWQGIDGSEVLSHFPPADTYNASASISQLRDNARNYKDHDRSRHSLMLFGYGDGGGGPTRQMLETLSRVRDLQGVPRTRIRSSDEFFQLLENDCTDRPVVAGELYFEYHRGTYTTQANIKRANRKNEWLLHDVEFLSAMAHCLGASSERKAKSDSDAFEYPSERINALWETLLLNQFHDILPGSSITQVYQDAQAQLDEVSSQGSRLRDDAVRTLLSLLDGRAQKGGDKQTLVINTIGFDCNEVAQLPGGKHAFVNAPPYGVGTVAAAPDRVLLGKSGRNRVTIENARLRATISTSGRVLSLVEKTTGREALAGEGNVFQIFDDHPTAWDAWDVDPFHLETVRDCDAATSMKVVTQSPLRIELQFEHRIGDKSTLTQDVRMDAASPRLEFHCTVNWQESHKMLKVAFPVNVRSMNATYEMQFGTVERPTHFNTAADLAKYEVPGHKFADLSEHGFGVALLSESKYGFSTHDNLMRLSLLRSPKHPDPQADMGEHRFAYALLPHKGNWRDAGVVAEAHRFNVPLLLGQGQATRRSFVSTDDPNLVIDTVKKAEDSGAIIVRLYECHGARGSAQIKLDFPHRSVELCDGLERPVGKLAVNNGVVSVDYTPYRIVSLLVK